MFSTVPVRERNLLGQQALKLAIAKMPTHDGAMRRVER
jgi:hypothetical protein